MIEMNNLSVGSGTNLLTIPQLKLANGARYGFFCTPPKNGEALLRTLAGADAPRGGSYRINGFDGQTGPIRAKEEIGFVPAHSPHSPAMTVYETLALVADLRGLSYERSVRKIHALLNDLEMDAQKDRLLSRLSRLDLWTVSLAGAILHNPEYLFVISPTAGRLPEERETALARLAFACEGRTLLFTASNMEELRSICTRVFVFEGNTLILDAPSDEISDEWILSHPAPATEPPAPRKASPLSFLLRQEDEIVAPGEKGGKK